MTVNFSHFAATCEENMILFCCVLQYIVLILATTVQYYELNNSVLKTRNVTQSVLTRNTLSALTVNINKIRYFAGNKEITGVTDFPELKNLAFEGVSQEVIPVFRNLPKIDTISLERNELIFVPHDRFDSLPVVYVHLRMNKIQVIEDASFGTKVKHIYLSCNRLRSIESRWFRNPARVEVLDFDANDITHLQEDSLKDFKALSYLYLMHNNLQVIGDRALPNRNFFSELWFGYNDLTEFPPSIFGSNNNVTVELFDISYNKLTFLTKGFMAKVKTVDTPLIDGNPWQCACYYNQIIRWMSWRSYGNVTPKDREGEPRCVVATGALSSKCVPVVLEEIINYFGAVTSPPPETRKQYCHT